MIPYRRRRPNGLFGILLVVSLGGLGCAHTHSPPPVPPDSPRELAKSLLPEYMIEPPDILQIDALYVVPLPPYRVKSLDALLVRVPKALLDEPIAGVYPVDPEGTINLGLSYGAVHVAGLTLTEAKAAVEKQLAAVGLVAPRAEVALAESRGLQQIRGPHLVRSDGTVGLGTYGSVVVAGLTLREARLAIETHLSQYLQAPEVSVDVAAYNSKVYYVVYDGGGSGQQVYRLPVTGNDTVLDAVSQLNGLSQVSDTNRIWVARPTNGDQPDQILPVDWCGVTARGRAETNYQLLPGDRIYVMAYPMVFSVLVALWSMRQ
ncbi:MAG: polysaccharide biosynthesis/export family protein, partial [Gemmataceae bacterium]